MKIFSIILSLISKANTIANLPKYWENIKSFYNKLVAWTVKYPKIFTSTFLGIVVILGLVIFFLSGCTSTVTKEKVVTAIETVEVKTPVPCKVDNLTCSFEGEQYIPTKKLLECLIVHKRILEICTGKNTAIGPNASKELIQQYLDQEVEKFNSKTK